MILAGDVGGTKTLLGLFRFRSGRPALVREQAFPSQDFPALEAIVERFLAGRRVRVSACAIGVAGPVTGGASEIVNVRWPVDARRLARRLAAPCAVINDLEATAWGVPLLSGRETTSLTPGLRPGRGNGALIAAGTGLGMALLVRDGARFRPSASEGGHQDFAPRDEVEIDLLRWLARRHRRVSVERVVSGPGIGALYDFVVDRGGTRPAPHVARRIAAAEDRNAAITSAGLARADAASARALDLFVSAYGAAAGDLALVAEATAGVWIGGGIAPRILPRLREGAFLRAFRDKGRLAPLVSRIPVRVILEPRTALLGAAAFAARRVAVPRPKGR